MDHNLIDAAKVLLVYTHEEMIANLILSTLLGVLLASTYKITHTGLSYSQSFAQTILFVCVVTAMVMMVIGSSLARAFALVGALSIIRFRTVIKDTKDTTFVFAALAMGMAAGTSNYFLACLGTGFIMALAIIVQKLNFGARYKSEFILRFSFDQTSGKSYVEKILEASKRSSLLHLEPSSDGTALRVTYDISLKEGTTADAFSSMFAKLPGVSEVILISSQSDANY